MQIRGDSNKEYILKGDQINSMFDQTAAESEVDQAAEDTRCQSSLL